MSFLIIPSASGYVLVLMRSIKENLRKCIMCGCSPSQDASITLHRFPKPGGTNSLRCELWAKYCFPNDSWSSPELQGKLHSQHKMLCNKHFQMTCFVEKKLFRTAVPDLPYDSTSTASNKIGQGQDTAVHQEEMLTTTTEGEPQTETIADADSRLSKKRKRPDGSPVSAPDNVTRSETVTPGELSLSSNAKACETLTNNSSPDSKNPLATDEHAPRISIVDEAGKESNIDDDAELLTLSDLEVEYLDFFPEEGIESTGIEETLIEADTALVDAASETERTTNVTSDANLLIHDADMEVEYLEAFSEEEIESTGIEETLTEADTALVDEASETERTINATSDANLLIYDADNLPIKNIICATCFSSGRTLYPLVQRKYFSMVQQFCSDVQFTEEDMICWECDAVINKMRKFKHQVVVAQSRFREIIEGDKVIIIPNTLSCMKTTEITHISISCDRISEADVKIEEELDIIENDSDGAHTEAMQTSPVHIHQPTDQSGDGEINDSIKILNENKVIRTYYNKTKHNNNVIHLRKLKDKAELLPQPDLLKEVCKEKVLTEDQMKEFRRNMRSKWKSGGHSCHKCIITFQLDAQLNEHNKKHDPKAGNYACRVCEQRFSNVGLRDAHCHNHFVVFECASCGLLAEARDAILGHFERLHREQRRACRDCGEVFMLFQEFRQHRLVAHGPKMTCEHCGKIFREWRNLSNHLHLHKKQGLYANKCQVCGLTFRWPRVLQKHLLEAHDIKATIRGLRAILQERNPP